MGSSLKASPHLPLSLIPPYQAIMKNRPAGWATAWQEKGSKQTTTQARTWDLFLSVNRYIFFGCCSIINVYG